MNHSTFFLFLSKGVSLLIPISLVLGVIGAVSSAIVSSFGDQWFFLLICSDGSFLVWVNVFPWGDLHPGMAVASISFVL